MRKVDRSNIEITTAISIPYMPGNGCSGVICYRCGSAVIKDETGEASFRDLLRKADLVDAVRILAEMQQG